MSNKQQSSIDDLRKSKYVRFNNKLIIMNGVNPLTYVDASNLMTAPEWAAELNKLDPPVTTIEGDTYYMFEVSKLDKFLAGITEAKDA